MPDVRMYCWIPHGYGSDSFYVASASLDDAKECVRAYIRKKEEEDSVCLDDWPDNYSLTVINTNEVITNPNG